VVGWWVELDYEVDVVDVDVVCGDVCGDEYWDVIVFGW